MIHVKRWVGASCLFEGSLDAILPSLIPFLLPEGFWEPIITGEHTAFPFQS